jgi:hypothetical protein
MTTVGFFITMDWEAGLLGLFEDGANEDDQEYFRGMC